MRYPCHFRQQIRSALIELLTVEKQCQRISWQRMNKITAVAIWPVTGQGFQNAKWPAVPYSQ